MVNLTSNPPDKPSYYGIANEAAYENNPQAHLRIDFPKAKVIDQTTCFGHKLLLIEHQGICTVAIEGTQPDPAHPRFYSDWLLNGLTNFAPSLKPLTQEELEFILCAKGPIPKNFRWIFIALAIPKIYMGEMSSIINLWANNHKIAAITGHSAGGLVVGHAKIDRFIFRIAFNSQRMQAQMGTFNLCLLEDPLSTNRFLNTPKYGIFIGHGGHGIAEFRGNLTNYSWRTLRTMGENVLRHFELPSASIPPSLHPSRQTFQLPNFQASKSLVQAEYGFGPRVNYRPSIAGDNHLQWKSSFNPDTGVRKLTTSFMVTDDELMQFDNLLNPVAEERPSSSEIAIPSRVKSSGDKPEPVSFQDQSKITDFSIIGGVGGGVAAIMTLASGAEIQLSATTGTVVTSISVELGSNFLAALGTGLIFAVPVVVVLSAIVLSRQAKKKKRLKHLKHDQKDAKKNSEQSGKLVESFNAAFEKFQNGEMDKTTFLKIANECSGKLSKIIKETEKQGRYADRHKHGRKFAFNYFGQKSNYEQVNAFVNNLAKEAVLKQEVEKSIASIKDAPFETIAEKLQTLMKKGVLSQREKHEHTVLLKELCSRLEKKEGTLDNLPALKGLVQKRMAVSFAPTKVAMPDPITKKHIIKPKKSKVHRSEIADKAKKWASELNKKYATFCSEALTGNPDKILNAGKEVKSHLDQKKDWWSYEIKNIPQVKTLGGYYQSFVDRISANVKDTLHKAEEVKLGKPSPDQKVYFTQSEWDHMIIVAALDDLKGGSETLKDLSKDNSEKDAAFKKMLKAAQTLEVFQSLPEIEDIAQDMQTILKIGQEYESYSVYHARLAQIRGNLKLILEAVDKMKDPSLKSDDYQKQYQLVFEATEKLLREGLSESDLIKVLLNPDGERINPEDAKKLLDWFKSIHDST